MVKMNLQMFGGRGGGSGMTSSSTSGGGMSREQMNQLGITRIENGKEVIVKNGVKYSQIDGWGYGNDFARTNGYGMSGNGERPTLSSILSGRDVDEVSYGMIDVTNYGATRAGAQEKYAQLTKVANGGSVYGTDYTPADLIRREANPGAEYMNYNRRTGRAESWKTERLGDRRTSNSFGANYHSGQTQLQHDLGSRAKSTIEKSMQRAATKWLKDNPDRSGQKGWRFNGRKWVQTGRG